jgi:hypothetical protein
VCPASPRQNRTPTRSASPSSTSQTTSTATIAASPQPPGCQAALPAPSTPAANTRPKIIPPMQATFQMVKNARPMNRPVRGTCAGGS